MGTDVPMVKYEEGDGTPPYGFFRTVSSLDRAFAKFTLAKNLSIELAEIENAVYRLAINIKKTQKRAKALENAIIPAYIGLVKHIQEVLEEKERDEFTRLKVIKKRIK
jgi:V/A-type H+-transporting ATPase subunit D